MMKNYREIQVSSTILVVIILGIILLGAVIFFIGVQVGKKQADLMVKTMTAQKAEETVSAPLPVPAIEESSGSAAVQTSQTAASVQSQSETKPTEQPASKTPSRTGQQSVPAPTGTAEQSTAPPPRTTTATQTAVPATGGNYFVQVGAFNDRSSARLEAEKYRKQGYNAIVKEPSARDRKPIYRVWLGGYKTREEAQKALSELVGKSVRNPGFFIVQQ
ncbi:MAG: SPOR domain-containing protein [Candidatus Saccharicenans sp.]|nr:SPOR domain-containing protein [Candidatus Saccharicenans sp.]